MTKIATTSGTLEISEEGAPDGAVVRISFQSSKVSYVFASVARDELLAALGHPVGSHSELKERAEQLTETNARLERELQAFRENRLEDQGRLQQALKAAADEAKMAKEYVRGLERQAFDVEKAADAELARLRAAVKALATLVANP